jgi:ABC-type long-subunit fatty acid transport system fused permease/ATPase subunit
LYYNGFMTLLSKFVMFYLYGRNIVMACFCIVASSFMHGCNKWTWISSIVLAISKLHSCKNNISINDTNNNFVRLLYHILRNVLLCCVNDATYYGHNCNVLQSYFYKILPLLKRFELKHQCFTIKAIMTSSYFVNQIKTSFLCTTNKQIPLFN